VTKQQWICERCGVSVTLHVMPSETPTHPCRKKAGRIIQLQPVAQQKGKPNE